MNNIKPPKISVEDTGLDYARAIDSLQATLFVIINQCQIDGSLNAALPFIEMLKLLAQVDAEALVKLEAGRASSAD